MPCGKVDCSFDVLDGVKKHLSIAVTNTNYQRL
jgi:hypothetical protein